MAPEVIMATSLKRLLVGDPLKTEQAGMVRHWLKERDEATPRSNWK